MKVASKYFRNDTGAALKVLEKLFGDNLKAVARLFNSSIRQAHSISPSSWELTLDRNKLELNVGLVAVLIAGRVYQARVCALMRHLGECVGRAQPTSSRLPIRLQALKLHIQRSECAGDEPDNAPMKMPALLPETCHIASNKIDSCVLVSPSASNRCLSLRNFRLGVDHQVERKYVSSTSLVD